MEVTKGQYLDCLKQHRPVMCMIHNINGQKNIWASGYPGRHTILLIGLSKDGRVIVCDSAVARQWSGNAQRFKIITWDQIYPWLMGEHGYATAAY